MLTALLLTLAQAPDGAPAWSADYTVRINDPLSEQVELLLTLTGLSGALELSLPERYAFAMAADARLVGELTARTDAGEAIPVAPEGPRSWTLEAPSARPLHLEWTVRLDHRTQPAIAGRDEYEHPYLAEDHGMLATAALLITPEVDAAPSSTSVRFELPDDWAVHAPWAAAEPGLYRPSLGEVSNDLVAIGAWDVQRQELDGLELTFAFAPGQAALRDIVLERAPEILAEEVRLFGGAPQPRYLFLFGRADQSSGYGGSPKTSSMTLYVSPDLPPDFAASSVVHLIAHEYHHTYMMAHCDPADELRFAMEGFTDWTAHSAPWRLGLRDDADFALELENQLAKAERALQGIELSLAAAGGEAFFEGRGAYTACYSAGLGVALWMDLALREQGWQQGVDRFVRELWGDPAWSDGERPDLEAFFERAEAALGVEGCVPLREFLTTPDPDLVALFGTIDVALERREEPLEASPRANFDGTTVLALDPEGAGARFGLRAGDRLATVNGVEVLGVGEVHSAWAAPLEGRLRVTLEREGERIELEGQPPTRIVFDLPAAVLERLR